MSDQTALASAAVLGTPIERSRGKTKYFLGTALVLLAFVLVGFGRTFFARAFFDVPPISWYLFVHGFVLTSWFLLLVAQTAVVAAHRTDLHRRLGVLGGFIAAALVGISLVAVLGFPAQIAAGLSSGGIAFDAAVVQAIVWSDLASLVIFSTFVGTALYCRRRSDMHKRLMLLASMAIVGPAVARIVPFLTSGPGPLSIAVQSSVLIGLPLTLVLHDLVDTRRVHRTTFVGVTLYLVAMFGAVAIANTGAGAALIAALQ
jgi:hypothetical protein